MKALFRIALTAGLALVAAACSDMKEAPEQPMGQKLVFTATREGVDSGTRSIRMDDGTVWWQPNEAIGVYYTFSEWNGYDSAIFTSNNSEPAQVVQFEGTIDFNNYSSYPTDFVAIYPASIGGYCQDGRLSVNFPSSQTGVEGNFSGNSFPALARSTSLDLAFWNICGGLKFSVSRDDIIAVRFKGNNEEVLAGNVSVGFDADGKPEIVSVRTGEPEITLMAPDAKPFKPGVFYYMTLLPASLESGFTMTFYTATGTGTLVSTRPQTVKRSVFGVLQNVDSKVGDWAGAQESDPEAVDLGLSVKWATFNVGAGKPEDYGDYFAWGETEPYYMPGYAQFSNPAWKPGKEEGYSAYSYKWADMSSQTITKYNIDAHYGPLDYKCILEPEDDAATANWGGDWRMPTITEARELLEDCKWEWTEENGVAGFKVSGKKQGYENRSIFIPAAGYRADQTADYAGYGAVLWSSSLFADSESSICFLAIRQVGSDAYVEYEPIYRPYGFSVRPVQGQLVKAQSIRIDQTDVTLKLGEMAQLTATLTPDNATEKLVYWTSSDESVVSVYGDYGKITANKEGTATITAISNDVTASCTVTVSGMATPDAVDLGLSVKWASFNLFAAQPEGRGTYFKWGETEPDDGNVWNTYKWGGIVDNDIYISKYNSDSRYGSVIDYLTTLAPEDDAATAILGGDWRMPTRSEIMELVENCNWEEMELNDVYGYKVSGKRDGFQDKWIFIPLSDYWSASLGMSNPTNASATSFNYSQPDDLFRNYSDRAYGCVIRPVLGPRIPVESVKMDDVWMYPNDQMTLSATVSPSNASETTVWFKLDDTSFGYIEENGVLRSWREGSTTITAYSNGITTTCNLTISQDIPTTGTWSLIGESIGEPWSTDIDMEFVDGNWVSPPTEISGAFKIRLNHNWNVNRGGIFYKPGDVISVRQNGPNIDVDPGTYVVTYNPAIEIMFVSKYPAEAPQPGTITIDGKFDDWGILADGTYSQADSAPDAVHPVLTQCKVYADDSFIYVYFEYDKDGIYHESGIDHVPFHCFINTDGDESSGGFSDMFSDACSDVLLEGFIYPDGKYVGYYDPCAFSWGGEPNGDGWGWSNWLCDNGICHGYGVEGKYEFAIDRSALSNLGYPVEDEFSIGFDIEHDWNSVGILPNASPSTGNAYGIAPSLKVYTQH